MQGMCHLKLEEQRNQLVQLIEQKHPQGSARNKVTVVFDGSVDVYGSMGQSLTTTKVLFSKDETADDRIKSIIAREKNAQSSIVVSDDRGLQYAVRSLGAKTMGVKTFLKKCEGPLPAKKNSDQKNITQVMKSQINNELKDIWLKKKG